MPFSELGRPALGISLLKSGLARRGIACDCYYANIKLAERIGSAAYAQLVDEGNLYTSAPEWLFAAAAFPEGLPPDQAFLDFVAHYDGVSAGIPLAPALPGLR